MKDLKTFELSLLEKIFELNSENKVGANTITVFTYILYKCEDPLKEIELSDYQMARELGLSRQTVITAKNKLKLLGLLNYNRNRGFPNRFILKGSKSSKIAPETIESNEKPIEDVHLIPEPKIIEQNSDSKYPSQKQFMDFAKTLKDYSEKLDDVLIQKYQQWKAADWKNSLGRPILNWRSTLQKNINILDFSNPVESFSLQNLPIIERPKLD